MDPRLIFPRIQTVNRANSQDNLSRIVSVLFDRNGSVRTQTKYLITEHYSSPLQEGDIVNISGLPFTTHQSPIMATIRVRRLGSYRLEEVELYRCAELTRASSSTRRFVLRLNPN